MKKIVQLLSFMFAAIFSSAYSTSKNASGEAGGKGSIYDFSFTNIAGEKVDFSSFKGKKILIVNTASKCGFTPQYADLEELHDKYKDKLVIIGFPCNDFGKQEPGDEKQITEFCQVNYGVSFIMASKVKVLGNEADPLFKWLTKEANPKMTGDIKWNFEKFLIDEKGKLIGRYNSMTKPTSDKITAWL